MQQSLLALGSAEQPPGAPRRSLALQAHDFGPADRAPRGHLESIGRCPRTGLGDAHHFRNHVPRPSHYDGVPSPDILSAHFVFVVERGVGHGDTAYAHGFQARHRRQYSGAPDLHLDIDDLGQRFFGRVLVCHREPRRARHETERLLIVELVDLVDHPVDRVRQLVPLLAHAPVKAEQPGQPSHRGAVRGHRQAVVRDPVQNLAVTLQRRAAGVPQTVGEKTQRALGGQFRIELPHGPRSGVAGVGELLFSPFALARVHPLEIRLVHDDLPAHLDRGGRPRAAQPERDRAHRPQIRGDVLPGVAVTPGGALHEAPALIYETDRETVEFRLRRVLDFVLPQALANASIEPDHVCVGKGVVERKHRRAMGYLWKLLERRPADPESR